IIGVVDRGNIIDGRKIRPGDVILGLESNGLHTNGYSLAREILFRKMRLKATSRLPGSAKTVGQELLGVQKNYQPLQAKLQRVMPMLKAKRIGQIARGNGRVRLKF